MKEIEIPSRIYLQIKDDFGEELPDEEITWCAVRINRTDVVYVRPLPGGRPRRDKR